MKYFVFLRSDGSIRQAGRSNIVPIGAYELSAAVRLSALSELMVHGWPLDPVPKIIDVSALVARPKGPKLNNVAGMYSIASCPGGTKVEVHDLIGEERMLLENVASEGGEVSFSLPDAGEYEVTITPPAPYLPHSERITVT